MAHTTEGKDAVSVGGEDVGERAGITGVGRAVGVVATGGLPAGDPTTTATASISISSATKVQHNHRNGGWIQKRYRKTKSKITKTLAQSRIGSLERGVPGFCLGSEGGGGLRPGFAQVGAGRAIKRRGEAQGEVSWLKARGERLNR